jgi:hypothetical protein
MYGLVLPVSRKVPCVQQPPSAVSSRMHDCTLESCARVHGKPPSSVHQSG